MSKSTQLLFCVESDNKSQTDAKYIQAILSRFYALHSTNVKVNYVYMGGKSNFDHRSTLSKIETMKSKYRKTGMTQVVYVIDTDRIDNNPSEYQFLKKIEAYCGANGDSLITFCPSIEEVLLKRSVANAEKVAYANRFLANSDIAKVSESALRSTSLTTSRKSNILSVIDDLHVF